MSYQFGESLRRNPTAALNTLAQRVEQAKKHLNWLDAQIEAATRELTLIQRKSARAQRQHSAYMRGRAADPAFQRTEAQLAYEVAMLRNPEDKVQGRRRLRLLDRELELASAKRHRTGTTLDVAA